MSRRRFLGGAGAAIGLPFLEAMRPVRGYALPAGSTPTRLFFFYVPNGIHMPAFTPSEVGTSFSLSPILEPLEGVRNQLTVITGLANHNAMDPTVGYHARGTASFLTAQRPRRTEGVDIEAGISCDQVAAAAYAGQTRLQSIQLGMEAGVSSGNCDNGYSCAYSRNISWSAPSTPMPKMISPAAVFDRLFAGTDPLATIQDQARRNNNRASVLDYVASEANRLSARLGATDREKLDEFMTGVRELETRIAAFEGDAAVCEAPDDALGYEVSIEAYCDLMLELSVVAMRCDLTRVVSFMSANSASGRSYDFIGVPGSHHELSHHQGQASNFVALEQINRWEIERFARLVEAMSEVEDGEGTLLDHSAVFFSSEVSDGNEHSFTNLPVVVAGRANGQIVPQGHLVVPDETPIARLFVSLIQTVDPTVTTFGADGDGPLAELAPTGAGSSNAP